MGICLNMIVKNEAKNLKRLFATLNQWIDYYVISDTGSTDDTIETIIELGKLYQIPGVIVKNDWVNFAYNRNKALEEAIREKEAGRHNSNWMLIIDADEEFIVIDEKWKAHLQEGISYTTYKKVNGLAFKHPFLIWISGQKFVWEGVVHNYLVNLNGKTRQLHTNEVFIKYNQFEGAKSHPFLNSDDKDKADIEILLKEFQNTTITKVTVQRYFQLAHLYKNIDDHENCVLYLKKIIDYPEASHDLRYISLVFIAKSLINLKKEFKDIEPYLLQAITLDSRRKEAYYYLAFIEKNSGNIAEAKVILEKASLLPCSNPDFRLWEENIYAWKIKYDLSILYYQQKDFYKAKSLIQELIWEKNVPKIEQGFLEALKKRM
jgi:glycosyltransferase involved in cell wall biosynthesis